MQTFFESVHLTCNWQKHKINYYLRTFLFNSTAIAFASFTKTALTHSSSCNIVRHFSILNRHFHLKLIVTIVEHVPAAKKLYNYISEVVYDPHQKGPNFSAAKFVKFRGTICVILQNAGALPDETTSMDKIPYKASASNSFKFSETC